MWVEENQSWRIMLRDAAWALRELVPHQSEAVLLAAQGYSVEEGSAMLGIAEGTFKSRVSRGRARLSALIDEKSALLLMERRPDSSGRKAPQQGRAGRGRDWQGVVIG